MRPTTVFVALLGFGNVARSFVRYVASADGADQVSVRVRAIADNSGAVFLDDDTDLEKITNLKESGQSLRTIASTDSIVDNSDFISRLAAARIGILVESLPTNIMSGEPALGLIASALAQGTNVVTVDKGPLVHGFEQLSKAAEIGGTHLGYGGTTGVVIPDELTGDRVLEIRGVLNGTTNYILTEMQQNHRPFEDALASAQADSIAEPDPSLDVEGWDTVSKTLILAKSLMGAETSLADVSRIGIGPKTESLIEIARKSGRVVRLVGRARIWQGRVRVSVAPKLIEPDSPFYGVAGTSKAAIFRTEQKGQVFAVARSGRNAISQTIVDDIARISMRDAS